MNPPIITTIVDNGLCIGCGSCAVICPQNVLDLQWNPEGIYNPSAVKPCEKECGMCLRVCPLASGTGDEDTIARRLYGDIPGISHDPVTGYSIASYVGHSEKHRLISASGGIATWLLETLLTRKIVDSVICVAPNNDPEKLFTFKVFDTPEDLREGAGSAYYPVEMSGVLHHILETPGKYVITGIPCFIKAIRLLQESNKTLKERIVVTVGLTCGQMKSKAYTEYLTALAGATGKVSRVNFRGKEEGMPVSNYFYSCVNERGEEKRVYRNGGMAEAWVNRWFTPWSCNFCDDIFAECADVNCMDAWLPEYEKASHGTSLVLVRSQLVHSVIEPGLRSGSITLSPIPIARLIQSQSGVIRVKREDAGIQLRLAQLDRRHVPKKRIAPAVRMNFLKKYEIILLNRMQAASNERYAKHCQPGTPFDAGGFKKEFTPALMTLKAIRRLLRIPAISRLVNSNDTRLKR